MRQLGEIVTISVLVGVPVGSALAVLYWATEGLRLVR